MLLVLVSAEHVEAVTDTPTATQSGEVNAITEQYGA
jgi:hypothetical protein